MILKGIFYNEVYLKNKLPYELNKKSYIKNIQKGEMTNAKI